MRASKCSFEDMLRIAAGISSLAYANSFIQVEYGKDELRAIWDAFVDSSDDYGLTFRSRKHICNEFSSALSCYIDDTEPSPLEVGH